MVFPVSGRQAASLVPATNSLNRPLSQLVRRVTWGLEAVVCGRWVDLRHSCLLFNNYEAALCPWNSKGVNPKASLSALWSFWSHFTPEFFQRCEIRSSSSWVRLLSSQSTVYGELGRINRPEYSQTAARRNALCSTGRGPSHRGSPRGWACWAPRCGEAWVDPFSTLLPSTAFSPSLWPRLCSEDLVHVMAAEPLTAEMLSDCVCWPLGMHSLTVPNGRRVMLSFYWWRYWALPSFHTCEPEWGLTARLSDSFPSWVVPSAGWEESCIVLLSSLAPGIAPSNFLLELLVVASRVQVWDCHQ